MAEQLGLQSLTIPEEYGGAGFTYVELIVVLEEMGAALLCAPVLLDRGAGGQRPAHLGRRGGQGSTCSRASPSGETIATLAITEDAGRWDADGIELAATADGDGWRLNGHKNYVIDGHIADLILVAAGPRRALASSPSTATPRADPRRRSPTMDQTRKQARLEFADTPARLIGTDGGAAAGLTKTLQLAAVALAAEQVGGAQRCLDIVGRVRQEPDPVRPAHRQLPGHQAQVRRHAARGRVGQVRRLLRRHGRPPRTHDELPVVASLAKSYCSEAYFHAAAENIQIHGGIGFTWEHPPTCTSSGPSPPSCSSATRPTTASSWPSGIGI